MSGSTHDKGIMILSGFLRNRFGQLHPIAMTASICFEQSYSGIDGDSASSTEVVRAAVGAVRSADSAESGGDGLGRSIRHGAGDWRRQRENRGLLPRVQGDRADRIAGRDGAAHQRREPDARSGDDGAIERGEFHIYPIDTIDRGIETLTGVRAGTIDEPGTINYLVDQRLKKMADILRDRPLGETRIVQEPAPNAARAQTADAAGAAALRGAPSRNADRSPTRPGEVALLTDLYELTVSAAFFEHGFNDVGVVRSHDAPDAAGARLHDRRGNRAADRGARGISLRRGGDRASRVAASLQARVSRIPVAAPLHRIDSRAPRRHDLFSRRTDRRRSARR